MPQAVIMPAAVAWPYASGPRHIGHVARFGVPSDVFSRYHRMVGSQVLGQAEPMSMAHRSWSRRIGRPHAAETADRYNRLIAEDLQALGLSYDLFTGRQQATTIA
jgi:methionyl-tRNA synthetase